MQDTLNQLREMRREAASGLVIPGQGGAGGAMGAPRAAALVAPAAESSCPSLPMSPIAAWQRTLEQGLRQAAERRHRLLLLNSSALPQDALLEALWPDEGQRAQVLARSQGPLTEALGLETDGLWVSAEAPDWPSACQL